MKQEAEAEIAKIHARLRDGMASVQAERASVGEAMKSQKDSHAENHAPLLNRLIIYHYECILMCSKLYEAKLKQARNQDSIKAKCESLIENTRRFRQMYKDGHYAMMKSQMKNDASGDEDIWSWAWSRTMSCA